MLAFAKKIIVAILTWQSRAVLRRYKPRIVAVTGSVGKTATKDAIYTALAGRYHVRASDKSFNSEIGLPLTILGLPNAWGSPVRWLANIFDGFVLMLLPARYPEWLVLEVGADRPGDIKRVAKWLRVDVAVITRLPDMPVHVEYFDSPEAVAAEKAELIKALKPGGTLVLFGDDERTAGLAGRTTERVLTFGFSEASAVRGENLGLLREGGGAEEGWPVGMQAQLRVGEHTAPVEMLGSLGAHALMPLLAAAAVGQALSMPIQEILEALKNYRPPRGRMRLLRGIKDTLIIDDTYNSSPAAVVAALDALALVAPRGRRIAVLGDMLELGRYSVAEHRAIGAHARKCVDLLLTIGFRARDIAEGALDSGLPDEQILQYEDARTAGKELQNLLQAGDCVLVKGSQSMRTERVVEEILEEPERAGEVLVRQDEEWKKR
jgi:UDP-N-acetylmuramoyl-tripeptide--D-alanyl-D-alanine ligase